MDRRNISHVSGHREQQQAQAVEKDDKDIVYMAAEVTTVPSLPNTDHRNTFDIVSSVSPSSAPPTAQSQRPRAIDVNIGSCGDHGNGLARSPTANEERAQRSSARGGISRACPLTLGLISKTCLPRGGTYVSTVIGPIQV